MDVSNPFERARKIALSLASCETYLAGRVFAAPQKPPGDRTAEPFRDEFRLIETADALPRAVQRDRHDNLAFEIMAVKALLKIPPSPRASETRSAYFRWWMISPNVCVKSKTERAKSNKCAPRRQRSQRPSIAGAGSPHFGQNGGSMGIRLDQHCGHAPPHLRSGTCA